MKSRESFVCCFCKTVIVELQMDPIEICACPIGPNADQSLEARLSIATTSACVIELLLISR